jgi:hypothetical protein
MASIYKRKGYKSYYIGYTDGNGCRQTVKGTADKAATFALARKLEQNALLESRGIVDRHEKKFADADRKLLTEHLADYENKLKAKGNTAKHILGVKSYINIIFEECDFEYPSDVDSDILNEHIKALKQAGTGDRTINAKLTAIKSFTRWMRKTKKLRYDPLEDVEKLNADTDKEKLYADMLQRLKDNTTAFESLAVMLKEHLVRATSLQETAKLNREIIERAGEL